MMRPLIGTLAGYTLAGCCLAAVSMAAPAPRVVGEADSGTVVMLAVGQTLDVRLTMSAGTGYRWQVAQAPAAAVLSSGSIRLEHSASPALAGGPETQIFEVALEKAKL